MYVSGKNYLNYPNGGTIVDTGDTVIWAFTDGQFMINSSSSTTTTYTPAQLQFHAPSEHTINGKTLDLEMQIVHLNSAGAPAAVIGILFDRILGGNTPNLFLTQL